jgi:hypothetical protein
MFTVSKDTTSSSMPQSFANGAMTPRSLIKPLGQNSFTGTLHELRINLPSRIPHILLMRGCKMQVHAAFPAFWEIFFFPSRPVLLVETNVKALEPI